MLGAVIRRRDRGAEERDELTPRVEAQLEMRTRIRVGLAETLGLVMREVTILPQAGGLPALGPAHDRLGRVLRWSLWAPHRRVLIDLYRTAMPPTDEVEDRAIWADANGLRYAVVEPGKRLTLRSLQEWLNG